MFNTQQVIEISTEEAVPLTPTSQPTPVMPLTPVMSLTPPRSNASTPTIATPLARVTLNESETPSDMSSEGVVVVNHPQPNENNITLLTPIEPADTIICGRIITGCNVPNAVAGPSESTSSDTPEIHESPLSKILSFATIPEKRRGQYHRESCFSPKHVY